VGVNPKNFANPLSSGCGLFMSAGRPQPQRHDTGKALRAGKTGELLDMKKFRTCPACNA